MQTEKSKRLIVERLEDRVLLSGLWQGVDVDGDRVTIRLRGPGEEGGVGCGEGIRPRPGRYAEVLDPEQVP